MSPTHTTKLRVATRVATPAELRRYGREGLLARGLLPPIAGGEPTTLEKALADLDADLKALSEKSGDAAAAPEAGAEATAPEAGQETAGTKTAEMDAREASLKAAEEKLLDQARQLGEYQKTLREHGGSRFVGSGAAEEIVKHVAAGGSLDGAGLPIADPRTVKAGPMVGVKELKESKSFARFFSAIKAQKEGFGSDVEREWLGEYKALAEATGSAGGFLVPPDWMPDVLQLFRGVTVVRRARPGQMVRFTAQMNQVSLSGGATAYYTPENAAIPTSQESFAQQTLLTPHNLTGLVPASNWLLADTRRTDVPNQIGVDAEQTIRQDLAVVMALKEDLNFLTGNPNTETGSPTGLVNISGIVSNPLSPGTNGFQPTLPQIRFLKNYVRRFNIPNARWTFFFHSDFLSYVEGLTDSLGRFLADAPNLLQVSDDDNAGTNVDAAASGTIVGAGAGMSGRLLNIPFYASNQIPVNLTQGSASNATWLLLVDMNQLVVGINQEMIIEASGEASYTPDGGTTWINAFQNNQTLFKATLRHDVNHRYPNKGVIQQSGVLVS